MRPLLLCALVCVALLCLLPSLSVSSSAPSALVSAAAPSKRASGGGSSASYVRDNRDLEEDDDEDEQRGAADDEDDEEVVPVTRRAAAATAASRRQQEEAADSGDADAAPMLLRLTLEHAVDAAAFTPRGEVTLNFNPARAANGVAAGKALTFSAPQSGSKRALRDALAANPSALYRLRFVQQGQDAQEALMASVPVCALAASHFHESLVFHVDPYGQLLSVSYRTPIADCVSAESEVRSALSATGGTSDQVTFAPKAKISFGKPGVKAQMHVRPGFDAAAQANAQAVGADAAPAAAAAAAAQPEKGPDGKPLPPPQTFWQKYWIYIVPLGIWILLQAVMAPQEQQGQGAPSGGAAAPARQ